MGKKANKPNVDKVVERVNKEFEKTSKRIEKLIDDALKQFDGLQGQVQEPVKKLLKEVDELRDREVKRFTDEFDRRMDEFHELQSNVMERLGISSGKSESSGKKKATSKSAKAKKTAAKKPAAKKTTAKKPAAKKPAAAAKKPAATKTPAAASKAPDSSDLTRIKGIGPATAKKMKEAGITSISQVANPSDADQEKLAAFSTVKGFSTFSTEAKKVV
jgi:predicted flap endonuclease-1-like 5' DNA nuclease